VNLCFTIPGRLILFKIQISRRRMDYYWETATGQAENLHVTLFSCWLDNKAGHSYIVKATDDCFDYACKSGHFFAYARGAYKKNTSFILKKNSYNKDKVDIK